MTQYQGHRSWNSWNVSLWIGNDEYLYELALECIRNAKNIPAAARRFSRHCGEKTPDGGIYNQTCIREALSGLEIECGLNGGAQ